jgi:hypothetical protein
MNYTVELETEFWEKESWTSQDCNSGAWVKFENGERWVATFFSYQNISSLRKKNQKTGECLNGKYFCATDMILIDEISRNSIETVIEEMIKQNEFEIYFSKCNE